MKVYEVKVDWAIDDSQDSDTILFSTEKKARAEFDRQIKSAKIWYDVFDEETGKVKEGWCLEESINAWEIWEDGYYSGNHCSITITEKEVL